jgi:hypothetical protein
MRTDANRCGATGASRRRSSRVRSAPATRGTADWRSASDSPARPRAREAAARAGTARCDAAEQSVPDHALTISAPSAIERAKSSLISARCSSSNRCERAHRALRSSRHEHVLLRPLGRVATGSTTAPAASKALQPPEATSVSTSASSGCDPTRGIQPTTQPVEALRRRGLLRLELSPADEHVATSASRGVGSGQRREHAVSASPTRARHGSVVRHVQEGVVCLRVCDLGPRVGFSPTIPHARRRDADRAAGVGAERQRADPGSDRPQRCPRWSRRGVRAVSQGLRVMPVRGASVSVLKPNSGVVVLPSTIAPAALQPCHRQRIVASARGRIVRSRPEGGAHPGRADRGP